MANCQICGLPEDVCPHKQLSGEGKKLRVYTERRRYGKEVTIVEGLTSKEELNKIAKDLKTRCAAGGTVKNNKIEIQGSHTTKVKRILQEFGYSS